MDNTIALSPEFTIAGQITPEQLKTAKQEGYQAVLNLRVPGEQGFLDDEENQAKNAGLNYVNIPVSPSSISEVAPEVIQQLETLPKPVLVHCGSALRAGVMVLAYRGTREGKSAEELFNEARNAGFTVLDSKPPMKQFVEDYIANYRS
ncbi:beta-lactamase hydrolase domain-containing protein [Dactylococcopsis salina]|uniref:Beta-lactamase hydrolase-like protein phosphatase-like domain-containing protein n=1 Tax=Dactylococcopsis salina (strain PCC 8305) TaxID=13035 RepID=K9YT29_DACS8|nr:protein tyrosine phosphatase family protein [Dactylococcopsis salina]AFZ49238.1 hypothetical protein Dacsa_0450 [Dactylococcopsis salina PCC 8305]